MANTGIYEMTDTWNAGSTTFKAISMDITDSASDAASLIISTTVGGVSKFSVDKTGLINNGTINLASVVGAQAAIDAKASLASPVFTGTPSAPTATGGTNTTQIATTEFVASAVSGLTFDVSNLTATWNNAGTDFDGIKLNVTDTASGAGSDLLDLQIASTSKFSVSKSGDALASGDYLLENPINTQTGTAYTLAITDAGRTVRMDNGSAIALTVPPNSSVAFPVGTQIVIEQSGAGAVTVTAGAGVTLYSRGSLVSTAGQYALAALVKTATDTWTLGGDIA